MESKRERRRLTDALGFHEESLDDGRRRCQPCRLDDNAVELVLSCCLHSPTTIPLCKPRELAKTRLKGNDLGMDSERKPLAR